MDGSDRHVPFVIGKSKKPCFFRWYMPVRYTHNSGGDLWQRAIDSDVLAMTSARTMSFVPMKILTLRNHAQTRLITMVCVDEFGAGFLMAYCIRNRVDKKAMLTFFKASKEKTGTITPEVFMSDDAPSFYNAWQEVMGDAKRRLLCAWHVDKNWREDIRKHVPDKPVPSPAGRILLLVRPGRNRRAGLITFKEYIEKHYGHRPKCWAACYRRAAGINTNMRLEALHMVLKYCYLDGKQNQRVDRLISVLLTLTRNKIFDRIIKFAKNAETAFARDTRSTHEIGCKIAAHYIQRAKIGQYIISLQSSLSRYVVTEHQAAICSKSCTFTCPDCNVFVHNVTCSCPGNELRRNICEHIHAVFRNSEHLQSRNMNDVKGKAEAQDSQASHGAPRIN
ncbi:uncharacterized protein LOC144175708 [Haemaphysalis longicornis]